MSILQESAAAAQWWASLSDEERLAIDTAAHDEPDGKTREKQRARELIEAVLRDQARKAAEATTRGE